MRPYHLYGLKPASVDQIEYQGLRLVQFSTSVKDPRGGSGGSKAGKILDFLRSHKNEAFFSTEIVKALKDSGFRPGDVMANLRRYERKGVVYVRGYRGHDRQSPDRKSTRLNSSHSQIS